MLYSRWTAVVTLLLALPAHAAFECVFESNSIPYDLNPLGNLRTTTKENQTPPTTSEAKVMLELCGADGIPKEDGVADEDQCPGNTRVCLKMTNHKPSASDPDRVTAVIPLWAVDTADEDVQVTSLGKNGQEGLRIAVQGPEYAGARQSLNLTLTCDKSASVDSEPSFVSYGANVLSLQWTHPDACPRGEDSPEPIRSGSGGGFFGFIKFMFWLLVVGLILYFAIGIFYNHQQYSARGWDLIPHRDFWREFPGLVQDLFAHVVAGLRGGSGGGGRGGYSSLG